MNKYGSFKQAVVCKPDVLDYDYYGHFTMLGRLSQSKWGVVFSFKIARR